ncbi:hypothetical protein [Coleofasciculus sp.]|uniref:hypothetical protein n=1 Tax=Coleofasciculus sp. TaxID=3100458 RepID=UPI003A26B425
MFIVSGFAGGDFYDRDTRSGKVVFVAGHQMQRMKGDRGNHRKTGSEASSF